MDDLYFIPKCIKPKFEGGRMLDYSYSQIPGTSPYPSREHEGTDYFKAVKRISKHEAEKIQEFLELKPYCYPVDMGWVLGACAPFEIAVQLWPKAPKIDAVYFLTHGIRFVINDGVSKWTDIQVQERDKIFKSYLYSILQLIVDKPYTLIQDVLHGQFLTFQFIRKVIFNNVATIIIWDDGSKTVSKCLPSDTYDAEIGVLLCILKKFYKPSHLNKMFKRAIVIKDKNAEKTHKCLEQIKKINQNPVCPYCKKHTMMLHHTFHTRTMLSETYYECCICHSKSPVKQTAREAEEAAMSIK